MSLIHGAFDHAGVPNAVVHAPAGFVPPDPFTLVLFLHGFTGCAEAMMGPDPAACGQRGPPIPGRNLAAAHARAGLQSLLVIPQLSLLKRDGSPGRFSQPGQLRAFLRELLNEALVEELGAAAFARVRRIVLVAHSGGYRTALALLEHSGLPDLIRDVVLLDALYAGPRRFARWLLADERRRLVSLYGGHGKTARLNASLQRILGRAGCPSMDSEGAAAPGHSPAGRHLIRRQRTPHPRFPERHLAQVLRLLARVEP